MRLRFLMLLPSLALLALAARAQQPKLDLHLDALATKASEVATVTLDGAFLHQGIAYLAEGDLDPSDRALLKRLQGVYVRSFEFNRPGQYSDADLAAVRAQLRAPGWSRIVDVRSKREGEHDEIYMLLDAHGAIQGVAILSLEPTEVDVVNIVGPLELSQIAKLGGHFGIPRVAVKAPQAPERKP